MNTKQIAAEAAKEIWNYKYNGNSKTAQIIRSEKIIEAAIEKATEASEKHAAFCTKIANERLEEIARLKSRAAHASESVRLAAERLRYECETTNEQESGFAKDILTLVEFAESHVGRAAHANE